MTPTATRPPFTVERIDLRDPDGNVRPEVWECETAEDAAVRFDSEATPQNWPISQIADELETEGLVDLRDNDVGVEVIARRS